MHDKGSLSIIKYCLKFKQLVVGFFYCCCCCFFNAQHCFVCSFMSLWSLSLFLCLPVESFFGPVTSGTTEVCHKENKKKKKNSSFSLLLSCCTMSCHKRRKMKRQENRNTGGRIIFLFTFEKEIQEKVLLLQEG